MIQESVFRHGPRKPVERTRVCVRVRSQNYYSITNKNMMTNEQRNTRDLKVSMMEKNKMLHKLNFRTKLKFNNSAGRSNKTGIWRPRLRADCANIRGKED